LVRRLGRRVTIIGGGVMGLMTAYYAAPLADAVTVLERSWVGNPLLIPERGWPIRIWRRGKSSVRSVVIALSGGLDPDHHGGLLSDRPRVTPGAWRTVMARAPPGQQCSR
jgi:glycine/D-amino acid oxidase-like deaminating enzyme